MSGSSAYPRVLVVGQHFDRRSGGGITLSNLFEGWPRDRLAAAVMTRIGPVERDVCSNYYVLGSAESVWVWPLSLVPRTETPPSRTLDEPAASGASDAPSEPPLAEGSARRTLKRSLDAVGVHDELRTMRVSEPLLDWVREFEPDIIYSQLHDLPIMVLVDQLCDATGLPLALHFMDDWPSSLYREGLLAPAVRRHMERLLRSVVNRASVLMVISDLMAAEYATRYGRRFVALHNPVDLERWDRLAAAGAAEFPPGPEDVLDVMYAGRVGTANTEGLVDLASAIGTMAAGGGRVRFRVFTSDFDRLEVARMAELTGVEVRPAVAYDSVPALLESADVLALPLDFNEEGARYSRLSMPTKLTEYLASARPVLVYAPTGSAAAEYARDTGWALLVDQPDPAAIRQALGSLVSDGPRAWDMGRQARATADRSHDATVVREEFRKVLAGAPGPGEAAK